MISLEKKSRKVKKPEEKRGKTGTLLTYSDINQEEGPLPSLTEETRKEIDLGRGMT